MTIDASAVARVVGIETQFEDMRDGGVLYLPQHIAVFVQGSSAANYSLEKWLAPSAGATGARYGFGSMAHLVLDQLLPANGDGVGTVPVYVYPLEDDPSATAAVGDITPSGTATKAGSYRIRVAGILSAPFVIPAGPVDVDAVNASIAAAIGGVLKMPVTVSHTYGTVTRTIGPGNTGDGTLTALSASGAPVPGAWSLVCNTAVANGGVFTLTNPNGTVVSTAVTMTPGVGAATVLNVGGLQFTLTDGTANFIVGDAFTIDVPADDVVLTLKWKGPSGNGARIEVLGDDLGVTFAITQPAGGLVNPSVADALGRVGNVWVTFALNGAPIEDTDILDAFQEFGEGRRGELVHMPLAVVTGNTHPTVEAATAISSTRITDRINGQLVCPGSVNFPFVVAARQLARIARLANNNPPVDYGSQRATGLIPGADGVQWNYLQRDQAVKAGSSTIEVKDGVVNISDVVTFYRPAGEEPPAYRHVVDIVREQQCVFNLALNFATEEWDGAPLIPDDQPTVNPRARKPKAAKAQAAAMLDGLGAEAIISNPAAAKKKIRASINSQNPKRLDLEVPVQFSGNSNIVGIVLKFGFFFGTSAVLS